MQKVITGNESISEIEKTLVTWCQKCTESYTGVDIRNLTSSWKDGLAFNALIHFHRPHLFDYHALLGRPPNENLIHAFQHLHSELGLSASLEPEDVNNDKPDKKSIVNFITSVYNSLLQSDNTIEPYTRQRELAESDGSAEEHQAARSDSPTPSSVSTMSEWDDYNETLNQVLAWLLQAETQLEQQEHVSDQVNEVKEQFREHEDFMMILTNHQASVGSVLEFGSQLINEGHVFGKEEEDIRKQMSVLSERWENLRVSAMERQTQLHQHLMKLQQLQLKDLSDWLNKAEAEMGTTSPIASDLDIVKQQVETHRKFQEELENQQQHVNSLSHMVVVVDDSESSESATVDLENQLAVLGERWSTVCKWTENRWEHLQGILSSWQVYQTEETVLDGWLRQKEDALKEISVSDMGDKDEVQEQINKLKALEMELTQQQNSFGKFNLAAQHVAQALDEDSPAIKRIQDVMEDFNQRWNKTASMLNTKMKHFRGMEAKLQIFLQELDDNLAWIAEVELLLQPENHPQKELVESLNQAVKKRRSSIVSLTQQGEDIMQQSQVAGQSVTGLQKNLHMLKEKWERLSQSLQDHKVNLEYSERKNTFVINIQKIVCIVNEINEYIDKKSIECKDSPTEFLIIIEIKLKEIEDAKISFQKLADECKDLDEPTLKLSLEAELQVVLQKIQDIEVKINLKQTEIADLIQQTPPPEFLEQLNEVQGVLDEVFSQVTTEFQYHDTSTMQELESNLKMKVTLLHDKETLIKSLIAQQTVMLKGLSLEKQETCENKLTILSERRDRCLEITETRIQRVSEAVLQTRELETAMTETFSWMDDVDKFLEEITGTIAEGDVDTIESQISEVEALQQDIETVQKKVSSLIETATLIMKRSDDAYAQSLKNKLSSLNDRWDSIVTLTVAQKESLRAASLAFQEIGNGVKDVIHYFRDVEKDLENDTNLKGEDIELAALKERYQNIELHLQAKLVTLQEYVKRVEELIAVGGIEAETPQVSMELQQAIRIHIVVTEKVKSLLLNITTQYEQLKELDECVKKQYIIINTLDSAIGHVTDRLNGDLSDLKDCLTSLKSLSSSLNSEEANIIVSLSNSLESSTTTTHKEMIVAYESRMDDIKERYQKVHDIVEGEMSKRQQLQQDVEDLQQWIIKIEVITKQHSEEKKEFSEQDCDSLEEEISRYEAILHSAESALTGFGDTEERRELVIKIETIKTQWKVLVEICEGLKSQKGQKDLEIKFSTLEGSALSGIDNLRRKMRKVKMLSPGVNDLEIGLGELKELHSACDQIMNDIDALKEVAKKMGEDIPAVKAVEEEFKSVKATLDNKQKSFEEAINLSDTIYTSLQILTEDLDAASQNLESISVEPPPELPHQERENIEVALQSLKERAGEVEKLLQYMSKLRDMSDEQLFVDLEAKVKELYLTYSTVLNECSEKLEILVNWAQEIEDYRRKIEQLNIWIDARLNTLESIGGLPGKDEVEMELQKLKGLKQVVGAKESELDSLKQSGDLIVERGGSLTIVDPLEKEIFQRWDDLEKKINAIELDLEAKMKEFETNETAKVEIVVENEIQDSTALKVNDADILDLSAPCIEISDLEVPDLGISLVSQVVEGEIPMDIEVEPEIKVTETSVEEASIDLSILGDLAEEPMDIPTISMSIKEGVDEDTNVPAFIPLSITIDEKAGTIVDEPASPSKMKVDLQPSPKVRIKISTKPKEVVQTEPLKYRIEDIIITIQQIEQSITELRCTSSEDFKVIEESVQKLEDDLEELQPRYERLLEEANDTFTDHPSEQEGQAVMKLTRSFGGVHNNLAVCKHSLQGAEYKLSKLNLDIMKVQLWLQDVEMAMAEQNEQYSFEEIESNIEINAAEMEGVNIRAEQLAGISTDSLIPKKQIASLNKRFKIISSQFEQFQRPEERVTTYKVSVQTGSLPNADTRANVSIKLFGEYGNSDQLQLKQSETKRKKFQSGQVDLFSFHNQPWLGKLSKLRVWHDNDSSNPEWYLSSIYILDELSGRLFCFVFDTWLSKESGAVLKEIPVSAMGLHKEAPSEVLIKKHQIFEIHWLFENINIRMNEPKLKAEFFVADIKGVIGTIEGIQLLFKHPCFLGKPYDNLDQQDKVLEDIAKAIEELNPTLTKYMLIRNRYLDESLPEEMHQIDINLTNMRSKWNTANKEYKTKYFTYEANSNVWRQFHDYMEALSVFLSNAEAQLADKDHSDDEAKVLRDNLQDHDEKLKKANQIAADICVQSSDQASKINETMSKLNIRWTVIKRNINNDLSITIDVTHVINELQTVEHLLEDIALKVNCKPHPVVEDDIAKYISTLENIEKQIPDLEEKLEKLDVEIANILSQDDISPTEKEEFQIKFQKIQKLRTIILSMDDQKQSAEVKLKRANDFLEELEELSMWMSATKDLLEGQKAGKLGYHLDPRTMKLALETRKGNVESINRLLNELKSEGELGEGQFPDEVGEKIVRLNLDWQVIISLAKALKEEEEIIITESVQMVETSQEFNILDSDGCTTVSNFETNVPQLQDWLKIIETKLKGLIVRVGDEDDMESVLSKAKSIKSEMDNRKCELEEVIEMGAALNLDTDDESVKYSNDDKVTKLKDHWETVSTKVESTILNIDQMNSEIRHFNEGRLNLMTWLEGTSQQLEKDEKIATSIDELEAQLKKHKVLQDELVIWCKTYNIIRNLAEKLQEIYTQHEYTEFNISFTEITETWTRIESTISNRQVMLQKALDNLQLFHKDMTAANTWLSNTESRVADLDSHVEACHAEDSGDTQGIKDEMNALEGDVKDHQAMFQRLNETGNAIITTLEEGEVRIALQSKLDDMNDRWNSLGLHMVDIRDRTDGSGEWRQLLSDMNDIKGWLERADGELKSQQPAGPYIESVQQQSEAHEAFKEKLNARIDLIEQSLDNGHLFLQKNQVQSDEVNLVSRAAANLQVQLEHVDSQWKELKENSNQWESSINVILDFANRLLEDIDYINTCLTDLEKIRDSWQPVSKVGNIHVQLEEVKTLNEKATSLEEQFSNMSESAKELKVHNIALSKRTEGIMDQLHERWNQLLIDCQARPQNLQNIMRDDQSGVDDQNDVPLIGSVADPWERGQSSLSKVPYFINHDTKTTQWDHPKMTELFTTLSDLNAVKYAAYRTSMKLRAIQKTCNLDLVSLHDNIADTFANRDTNPENDDLIDVSEMITVLVTLFENVNKEKPDYLNVPECADMTLNWLLNVFDSGRIGKLRVLSFKVGVVLMSRAKLEDKWKYLFEQIEDGENTVDSKKLGLLLHDCVQIPRQLGEIAAFGGSNIEPSVRSCFEKANNDTSIGVDDFVSWTAAEPQSLVWMPVLHRLAAAETARHEAKCQICKDYPIVGFRYRCLKCFNYDLCQNCFWSGRISKSHRITHPMHQYSLATTTGEDMSDFVKLMKNKFKARRYKSRPPKKLGYLPVQTLVEGTNIETPSMPVTTPDMTFQYSMNGSASPGSGGFEFDDMNEEHNLIQQMCHSLNTEQLIVPKSPSQILKSLDHNQQDDINERIETLDEEHARLLSEYNHLKGLLANPEGERIYTNTADPVRDADLIAEAKVLRQHKGRLESRMQTLEDHNRQLEAQLHRLRQLLEQPPNERDRVSINIHTTPSSSSSRVTPALTPSSSYHGTPELERREPSVSIPNGYSSDNIADFQHVTSQIEHAFTVDRDE